MSSNLTYAVCTTHNAQVMGRWASALLLASRSVATRCCLLPAASACVVADIVTVFTDASASPATFAAGGRFRERPTAARTVRPAPVAQGGNPGRFPRGPVPM